MKKKLLAVSILLALALSPVAGVITKLNVEKAMNNSSTTTSTRMPTDTSVNANQEQIEVQPGGTIDAMMGVGAVQGVNPMQAGGLYGSLIIERIFETLTVTNPKKPYDYVPTTDRWIPNILESYNHEPVNTSVTKLNGTEVTKHLMRKWTLNLREGWTFHDGEPVDPEDLVFTFQFLKWLTHFASSETWSQYYGPTTMAYVTSKVKNDTAIELYSNNLGFLPDAKFPILSMTVFPKHIYQWSEVWNDTDIGTTGGQKFNMSNWWDPGWGVSALTIPQYNIQGIDDPVITGCGSWVPSYWDAESPQNVRLFEFRRYSDYYWNPVDAEGNVISGREWISTEGNYDRIYDPEDPYLWGPYAQKFVYHMIPGLTAQWRSFQEGTVDFLGGTPLINHFEAVQDRGFPAIEGISPDLSGGFAIQANHSYLTGFREFRFSMALAMNKYELVSLLRSGYGQPIGYCISPAYGPTWHWEPPSTLADPLNNQARNLIAQIPDVSDTGAEYLKAPGVSTDEEWVDDDHNIMVNFHYPSTSPIEDQQAQAITGYIEDAGVKVNLVTYPTWGGFLDDALAAGTYDLGMFSWSMGSSPAISLFANYSAFYADYKLDTGMNESAQERYYTNSWKYLLATNQTVASEGVYECEKLLYYHQPHVTAYTPETLSTYRNDKWAGIIESYRGGGLWAGEHSYRKMASVSSKPTEAAEGFNVQNGKKVKGTFEYEGIIDSPTNLTINVAAVQVDQKSKDYKTVNTSSKPVANGTLYSYSFTDTIDTTNLMNGWHTVTVEWWVLGRVYEEHILQFKVENPVPLTQQVLPMAAITGVIGAIVVGAIVYAMMQRRKPPKE